MTPYIENYWYAKAHRARMSGEHNHARRIIREDIDRSLLASGRRWPIDWTDAEKEEATEKLLSKTISEMEKSQ